MNMSENSKSLSLTYIERQIINELIAIAPEAQKTLHKLLKAGNTGISQQDFSKINSIIFLLSEFVKRTAKKDQKKADHIDVADTSSNKS